VFILARYLLVALLVLLLVRAAWRFLVGVVDGASRQPGRPSGPPARGVPMARDPICGTFVVPGRALTLNARGEVFHFCSEQCREAFRQGLSRQSPPPPRPGS